MNVAAGELNQYTKRGNYELFLNRYKKYEERKKNDKKDILIWQSLGQIVYDKHCGSVCIFRAVSLEQESVV